jgi:hypothetical protein
MRFIQAATPTLKTLSQHPAFKANLKQGAESVSQCMKALMQKTKEGARDVLQNSRGLMAQGAAIVAAGAVAACKRRRDEEVQKRIRKLV